MARFLIELERGGEEKEVFVDESQEEKASYYAAGVWHITQTAIDELGSEVDIIGVYDNEGRLHSAIGEYL